MNESLAKEGKRRNRNPIESKCDLVAIISFASKQAAPIGTLSQRLCRQILARSQMISQFHDARQTPASTRNCT